MSAPSNRSRPSPVALAGMAAAVVIAWANGLATRQYQLSIGDVPYRDDYYSATGVSVGTAAVLVLGMAALAVLRAPWWFQPAAAAAAVHHAVLATSAYELAGSAPIGRFPGGSINGGVVDALMPGSWPLLAVVGSALGALVCASRARAGRRPGRIAISAISAAFVLAAMTGPVAWYLGIHFFTFWDEPAPAHYQNAIITAVGTAAVLLLGALLVWGRWGTWFQLWPAGFGVLVQAVVVAICLPGASGAADPGEITSEQVDLRFSLELVALLPTSWVLLLVLVWAVITSTPAPRGVAAGRVSP